MAVIFEGVDAPGSVATPYAMAGGDVFYGSNAAAKASDWIAVTLRAGVQYTFGAVGIGAAHGGLTDPLVRLHGGTGLVLAENDDGGPGLTASLTYRAGSTGTYYIEVKALAGDGYGDYGLAVTEGARVDYGADLGAAVLYRDGYSWAAAPGSAVNLTWGVRASGPAEDAYGRPTPFIPLSAAQTAATQAALANYADVARVSFTQVNQGGATNAATILVGAYDAAGDGAGAYALFPGNTGAGSSDGDLWINNDAVSRSAVAVGSYDYWVFEHELGHALGLSHPGDYNAAVGVGITYLNSAQFVQDSRQYTVMSYFDATQTEPSAPGSYPDTLMMYDICAVQSLYGINGGTRAGNDVYGFNGSVGGAYDFSVNTDPLLCIWDGAGRDTLDLSGFGGRQTIDLNAGRFSDVGGFKGNLSIAVGCKIENAVGGRGADIIHGNGLNNVLRGGRGADVLAGGAGDDRMTGGPGADGFVFVAGSGRDLVRDFQKATDLISLGSDLWGGRVLTAAGVVAEFVSIRGGNLVFDFGVDDLILLNVASQDGIADRILLI